MGPRRKSLVPPYPTFKLFEFLQFSKLRVSPFISLASFGEVRKTPDLRLRIISGFRGENPKPGPLNPHPKPCLALLLSPPTIRIQFFFSLLRNFGFFSM